MKLIKNVKKKRNFHSTVGSLNLGALCMGLAMGWPSRSFVYHYAGFGVLAYMDVAWIESTISAGASIGSIASIFISNFYGRRISFGLSAALLVGFWIFLFAMSADKVLIIFAAAVAGIGVGLFSATAILYVTEISSAEGRGFVGATVIWFGCLGVFFIQLFSYFFDVLIIVKVMAMLPLIFLASIYILMIESPFYLFQQGMILEAKISLKTLRDYKTVLEVDEEFKTIEAFFDTCNIKSLHKLILEIICPKNFRPMTLIFVPLLCISQMIGITAIKDYTEKLVETVYPNTGKLVTSFIDVISTVCCLFAIERIGRKPLIGFTIIGSGVCCLILSIYNLIDKEECRKKMSFQLFNNHRLIPVMILCFYYGIYALGLTPVLPIITGEIFPCRAKTVAVGISASFLYLTAFCMQRSYEALNKKTSSCMAFAYFTIVSSVCLPFALVLLPETKGKSLLRIQNDLEHIIMVNY